MSNRREVLRNWIGTAETNKSVVNLEAKRAVIPFEASMGLLNITKLRSKILSPEEVAIKASEDPKSATVTEENIKPDSRVVSINRVGREDPKRLRRRSRRGRCGCTEKPCQRRSCPLRTAAKLVKAA